MLLLNQSSVFTNKNLNPLHKNRFHYRQCNTTYKTNKNT